MVTSDDLTLEAFPEDSIAYIRLVAVLEHFAETLCGGVAKPHDVAFTIESIERILQEESRWSSR